MALIPHYVQSGGAPAVNGAGFGMFGCPCGQSLLISGYEPRHFLGIAIQCAACGTVSETPGLPDGAAPPNNPVLLRRGMPNPPSSVAPGATLIGQDEVHRLAALYLPRDTRTDLHRISDSLLDDIEFQQRRWTQMPLDPAPSGYKAQPLAWAVHRMRERSRDPDWTSFADDADMVAMTVIAAFRDLFGGWVHHPLFGQMVLTAAADGFSPHAMARFAAAKALALAGNRISFVIAPGPVTGPGPIISGQRVFLGNGEEEMALSVQRFSRFEWPDDTDPAPAKIFGAVIEAMDAARGHLNRLHPGILVLSTGASRPNFDRMLLDSVTVAIASHGKRHRGLAAMAVIAPKTIPTGQPGEVRFGYNFHPFPNRAHAAGSSVLIGSRQDHAPPG